jgi:hypothetical protein
MTIHAWHIDIEQNEVGRSQFLPTILTTQDLQRLNAITGNMDRVCDAVVAQFHLYCFDINLIIVNQ